MFTLSTVTKLAKASINAFLQDNCSRLGAALSFYTILSLPPLLMLLGVFTHSFFDISWFVNEQALQGDMNAHLIDLLGADAAGFIINLQKNSEATASFSSLSALISLGVAVLGAMGVFIQLQDAFNTIWQVSPKSGTDNVILRFLKTRATSLGMILSLAALLLVASLASLMLNIFSDFLYQYLSAIAYYLLWVLNGVFSYGLFILVFALIFKNIPDVELEWKQVWLGAFVTALLFSLGRYGLGWYLSGSDINSSYGVAGSMVVLLVWIFYSAQIMFLGAEFTKVWNLEQGNKIIPKPYAQRVYIRYEDAQA